MLSDRLNAALNTQIKNELESAYIYLGMASYFEDQSLPGFANWMRVQYQEETLHAMKFFDFVYERDGKVELFALEKPAVEYESPLAAFEAALKHEKYISGTINHLYQLAQEEGDYASRPLLHWFIEEQVEEEASAKEIVDQLKLVEGSKMGTYMLDKQLAARTFTPAPAQDQAAA
jgi:ferritin